MNINDNFRHTVHFLHFILVDVDSKLLNLSKSPIVNGASFLNFISVSWTICKVMKSGILK